MPSSTKLFKALSGLTAAALLAAACAPAATPTAAPEPTAVPATEAPQPTEAPKPTDAPVATEAPAATYEGMKVEAESCDYGGEFKSIEAVDQYTVKFTLCSPDPDFLSKIAFSVFAIQDKDYLDANSGDSVKMSEQPNGTGPYMVDEWRRGEQVTFSAFGDYWGDKAKTETAILRWNADSAAKFLALQSGEVDAIDNAAAQDIETATSDSTMQVKLRPSLNIFYLGFNNTIAPFDKIEVRKAIALALDRQRIIDTYYPAGSTVAAQFVPDSFSPGFSTTGDGAAWYDQNLDEAKALLEQAGATGAEIEMAYRPNPRGYLPEPPAIAQEIQAQLAEIGLKVTLKEMESTEFLDSTAAGKVGFYLLGWGADYPGATNFYNYHFANANNLQFGEEYTDLADAITQAGQISDPAERQALYDQVAALVKEHIPMIPVAHGGSAVIYSSAVEGAHTSPLGNELFYVMSTGKDTLTFVQNGEPAALWCGDETDGESLRACNQIYDALMQYELGGVAVQPALAESYTSNADGTEWVFTLRQGVKFHDGADLDANDVVATYEAQWNAKSPNHVGREGNFEYFGAFFGAFLNAD